MDDSNWEYQQALEKEIASSNFAQLLELFKRENEKYENLCIEYMENLHKLTTEKIKELVNKANTKNDGRRKIALKIAEIMTDTKRVQPEIKPKPRHISNVKYGRYKP